MRSALLLVMSLLLAVAPSAAQTGGLTFGVTHASAFSAGGPLSVVETTRFRALELDVTVLLGKRGIWAFEYTAGLTPLARVHETARGPASVAQTGDRWVVPTELGRVTSRGVGLRPLGIQAFGGSGRTGLYLDAAVGALHFDVPTPAANTARFNFTAQLGAGIRVHLPNSYLRIGYRLHHLSNAGRGAVNPGVDSHMLVVGWAWRGTSR